MILTSEHNLEEVKVRQQANHLGQMWFVQLTELRFYVPPDAK